MIEWVPYHCNVNAEFYLKTLWKLHERIRKKRLELWDSKSFIVYYDNAPSHHTQLVEKFLEKNDMFVIHMFSICQIWPLVIFFSFSETELSIEEAPSGGSGWHQIKIGGVLANTNFRRLPMVLFVCVSYTLQGEYFKGDKCILEQLYILMFYLHLAMNFLDKLCM